MKAKIVADDRNHKRQILHELLPLDTPFNVGIEPSGYCNLKCNFCIHSLSKEKMRLYNHRFGFMEQATFDILIEQLQKFPKKIKNICFGCQGEPLMNKNLPYMVEQVRIKEIAEQILIISNGILLNEDLIKKLIKAGGDKLCIKISINGFCANDYRDITGVKVDFDSFVHNLKYLYENKNHARISIKTMTSTLELTGKTESDFFCMFGEMCDLISIENTVASHDNIHYKGTIDKNIHSQTNATIPLSQAEVCTAPFMRLAIYNNADVKICGLYDSENENLIENFLKTPIIDIWNGEKRHELLVELLRKKFCGIAANCKVCRSRSSMTLKQDWLDPYADKLLKRI